MVNGEQNPSAGRGGGILAVAGEPARAAIGAALGPGTAITWAVEPSAADLAAATAVVADAGSAPKLVERWPGGRAARATMPLVVAQPEPWLRRQWSLVEGLGLGWAMDLDPAMTPVLPLLVSAAGGGGLDLRGCLGGGARERWDVASDGDRSRALAAIRAHLASLGLDDRAATHWHLAAAELLANAERHGFGEHPSRLTMSADADILAMSVTDAGGRLSAGTVRRGIGRQLSGQGLLDEGGRGLFIAFEVANLLAVERRRSSTTVTLVAWHRAAPGAKAVALAGLEEGMAAGAPGGVHF